MPAALALLAAALAAAPGVARERPGGRGLFDAAGCRACHSIGGLGGNAGPDLTFVGFRRSREWLDLWLKDPRAWKPDTRMPNFRLRDPDRAAIVDYLASLQGRDFGGATPWNGSRRAAPAPRAGAPPEADSLRIARGRAIYLRAGCVACHGALGRGGHPNNNVAGGVIPPVNKVADGYTPAELESRIRGGRSPDPADPHRPPPLAFMPAWGRVLDENDIEAVARYLLSLAPPKKPGEDF